MRNVPKRIVRLLLFILLLTATACGGGGGGDTTPQQDQAVVTLTLSGGSDTIGSLDFDLILPAGFSLATDPQGDLSDSVLTSTLPSDSMVGANYLPEDALNLGQLSIAVISSGGFSSGAALTLTHDLETGEPLPPDTDFTPSNLIVTDLNGIQLSGYDLAISVRQQTGTP